MIVSRATGEVVSRATGKVGSNRDDLILRRTSPGGRRDSGGSCRYVKSGSEWGDPANRGDVAGETAS